MKKLIRPLSLSVGNSESGYELVVDENTIAEGGPDDFYAEMSYDFGSFGCGGRL
jgi:hypothetical protein